MRVKTNWLRELVDLSNITDENLIKEISLKNIEVESVFKMASGTNLVIGEVLSKKAHPDSDHLNICEVNVGSEILQIVCGAPNVEKGQKVMVALVGANLPHDVKIKHSKIRGVDSYGMICSLEEIGLEKKYIEEKYQNGIYVFNSDVLVGDSALKVLGLDDNVIELGLTPNRSDLLSMLGVARDVSSSLNRKMIPLDYNVTKQKGKKIDVKVETTSCNRYYAAFVDNVVVGESPEWLKAKLISFGCRSINNVVDITNYVLALFGQPLHAFDYDKLGDKIVVRDAKDGEEVKTLDDSIRKLKDGDIVITDSKNIVALGGVMGGKDTEVTKSTTRLVIEAASFDEKKVLNTSRNLNLRSESSLRFEKGVDEENTLNALNYCLYLLEKLCSAKCYEESSFIGCEKKRKKIEITSEKINSYLGLNLKDDEIKGIFERLDFTVEGNKPFVITIPLRRRDISIQADLIEEVIRIYGYDLLPETLPLSRVKGGYSIKQKRRNKIRNILCSMGLNEVVTYSLVNEDSNKLFTYNHYDNTTNIELLMPLTVDRKVLRKGLVPSLIECASYNNARKIKDYNVFELGKAYYKQNEEYKEEEILSILMTGEYQSSLWQGKKEDVDFYIIKGIIDNLNNALDLNLTYEKEENIASMHPKRTARILFNNEIVGFVGEVHPKDANIWSLKDVYVAEIKLEKILSDTDKKQTFKQISKMPSMERDLALVMKKDIEAKQVIEVIKQTERKLLNNIEIFDLYMGDKLEDGYKQLAVKLTFSSNDALTDEIVNQKQDKILKVLKKELDISLRA